MILRRKFFCDVKKDLLFFDVELIIDVGFVCELVDVSLFCNDGIFYDKVEVDEEI